jgi:hypothetical protein
LAVLVWLALHGLLPLRMGQAWRECRRDSGRLRHALNETIRNGQWRCRPFPFERPEYRRDFALIDG